MKVAVVGNGTMGNGIAQTFAVAGHEVIIKGRSDASLAKAHASIEKSLAKMVEKGKMEAADRDATLARLKDTKVYEDLADVDLVVEVVAEDMGIKEEIFKTLDQICKPEAILATNTSSLSITQVASFTTRPDKVIGMHFFNPVPMMKLVEVIKGQLTSDETHQTIVEVSKQIGKTPVTVNEAPGFVVNRILIPMVNEGIGILADGVATKEEIDEAMKLGANHPMGPLALADLIGLDVCLAIMEVLYNEFGDTKYRPHPLLRKMVRAKLLGRKTGVGFYDYRKKYGSATKTICPADIDDRTAEKIQKYTLTLCTAIGIRGTARIDFFLSGGRLLFNEINTMPGFTRDSLYPELMRAAGIPTPRLFDLLIDDAIGRQSASSTAGRVDTTFFATQDGETNGTIYFSCATGQIRPTAQSGISSFRA